MRILTPPTVPEPLTLLGVRCACGRVCARHGDAGVELDCTRCLGVVAGAGPSCEDCPHTRRRCTCEPGFSRGCACDALVRSLRS